MHISLPPIRACIFDLDGLLVNTEDLYIQAENRVLARYGRPPVPWPLRAQTIGRPLPAAIAAIHAWADLPHIAPEVLQREFEAERAPQRAKCAPMPGALALLDALNGSGSALGPRVYVALATNTTAQKLTAKIAHNAANRAMLALIPPAHRILSNPSARWRRKPAPDLYLAALDAINASLPAGEPAVRPAECLAFEDSVLGVEAGRRAGMRVVWVPPPELAAELGAEQEAVVLAGRTGAAKTMGLVGCGEQEEPGEVDDGWGERLGTLDEFEFGKYGIARVVLG